MKARRVLGTALAHASLVVICALTLYPVLIVIKTALRMEMTLPPSVPSLNSLGTLR